VSERQKGFFLFVLNLILSFFCFLNKPELLDNSSSNLPIRSRGILSRKERMSRHFLAFENEGRGSKWTGVFSLRREKRFLLPGKKVF
jgi:hypothetical protein